MAIFEYKPRSTENVMPQAYYGNSEPELMQQLKVAQGEITLLRLTLDKKDAIIKVLEEEVAILNQQLDN